MRYENPLYMAEDAGAADLIAGGRLQLGISRGSPEQVIDGWRYFGYVPPEGKTDADMARHHTEVLLEVLLGKGFAQPNPRPMFPNPPGLLRVEPHAEGLRERIWWGAGSNATAVWAAKLGMNLQSSTLKNDESGRPFHVQQAEQIRAFREAWKAAGHARTPRVSVSRSIFALMDDRDRAYFGRVNDGDDTIGFLGDDTRAIFGRSYAAEPEVLIEQLAKDEGIAEADTLLLTVPNQLGVDYNAHVIETILRHVAPRDWAGADVWRRGREGRSSPGVVRWAAPSAVRAARDQRASPANDCCKTASRSSATRPAAGPSRRRRARRRTRAGCAMPTRMVPMAGCEIAKRVAASVRLAA